MTANITPKFQLELAKLEQTALLDLFEVDMRQLTGKDGNRGELFRFYAGMNLPSRLFGKATATYPLASKQKALKCQDRERAIDPRSRSSILMAL